jgi:hypothetical protein
MIEEQANPLAGAQILVHGEPHFEVERNLVAKDRHKPRIAQGERHLAAADAEAGA